MTITGNSLEVLKTLDDNSVDSVVTDPPYGLSFMGKKWDYDVPSTELWTEVFRVLKPGGHLLAFAGTRTQHRMAVNIEDAGFEIRDMIAWVYGSGFPKSLNIEKSIDKFSKTGNASWNGTGDSTGGALGYSKLQHKQGYRPDDYSGKHKGEYEVTDNIAKKWSGWGTALKPALEPITVARKPISEKNIAENVLKWGTGGINIDESRVGTETMTEGRAKQAGSVAWQGEDRSGGKGSGFKDVLPSNPQVHTGRFPANFIHDGSDEVEALFPQSNQSTRKYGANNGRSFSVNGGQKQSSDIVVQGDYGSASRFFYCAKSSKSERNKGLEEFEDRLGGSLEGGNDKRKGDRPQLQPTKNNHPTVKPVKLMQYLVRLVTPKNGVVLDPFMGSGTTGIACKLEDFEFIGIDLDEEYCKIAEARIEAWGGGQEKLF